jgi:hypothetical protein
VKAWSALSTKRLATAAVAGVSAVVLLSGCGFATRQQAAAIVNGDVIKSEDVQKTTEQLHTLKQFGQATEPVIVEALITARLLEPQIAKSGSWKPDELYASTIAQIPDATETTKDIVEYVALVQSQKVTEQDLAGLQAAVKSAHITVNPRYGSFHRTSEAPYFALTAQQPSWMEPTTPAAQPTQ